MIGLTTAYEAFAQACDQGRARTFLVLTSGAREMSFEATLLAVEAWVCRLRDAGYGTGHRVAVLVGNDPEHFVIHLALNALGASIVPLNPDLTAHELAYVLGHSEAALVIHADVWRVPVGDALRLLPKRPPSMVLDAPHCPPAVQARPIRRPDETTEAGLFYTSGTTGRPKGCVLTNAYYLRLGRAYAQCGGAAMVRPGEERILNPLPAFHQNAGIFSFMCAVMTGNCLVITDRFHASTWWREVARSGATIVHYLGVMPAILLKLPHDATERSHHVRFGIGAGVEPSLHRPFEERFGFPLVELWGMTEVGCGFVDSVEPRQVGTRAVGKPRQDQPHRIEIRLVNETGQDVANGETGELLVRRPGAAPADGMFAGYLKDPEATAAAWSGGWFHTGDAFWQDAGGTLHFVERRKNIIRRSGENIAAAEVEAVLLDHPAVATAAVVAVADELRDEEVLACIVPVGGQGDDTLADDLFVWCGAHLAYYKLPGWIVFLPSIPVTTTQKVQKARIFPVGVDPRQHPDAIDLRSRKKRVAARGEAVSS